MIKANELRIGNFVINEMGHKIEVNYNTLCNIFEFEAVYNPIPLTEEWLVRFGFDYEKTEDHSYYFKNEVGLFFHSGFWNFYSFDTIIKHVHQLQNLYFALTGQELELKDR